MFLDFFPITLNSKHSKLRNKSVSKFDNSFLSNNAYQSLSLPVGTPVPQRLTQKSAKTYDAHNRATRPIIKILKWAINTYHPMSNFSLSRFSK